MNFDTGKNNQKQPEEKIMMTICNPDGSEEEVERLVGFRFKDNGHEFVVYTKNERDENNNITVYISRVERSPGEIKLLGIDDDEFERVKLVLNELSKEDEENDYGYYDPEEDEEAGYINCGIPIYPHYF